MGKRGHCWSHWACICYKYQTPQLSFWTSHSNLSKISTVHQAKELDNVVSKVGKVAKLISHSLKSPKSLNYLSILLIWFEWCSNTDKLGTILNNNEKQKFHGKVQLQYFVEKKNVISKLTKGTPEIMIAEYSMLTWRSDSLSNARDGSQDPIVWLLESLID